MIEAIRGLTEGLSRLRDSLVVLESPAGWQDVMALATLPEGGVRSSCHADDVAAASKTAMAAGDVIEPGGLSGEWLVCVHGAKTMQSEMKEQPGPKGLAGGPVCTRWA